MDFNQPIGVVQGPGFDSRTEASRNRPSQIEWVAELSPRIRAHGRCTTDAYGSFLLDFVPAGRIFVHIGDDWVPLEVVAGKKTFLK